MPKWLLRKCVKCGKYTLETKKCPYCGSENVAPSGGSHVIGISQPHRTTDQIGYECKDCSKIFHYIGKE